MAPTQVPWGHKAFAADLGDDREAWKQHVGCKKVMTIAITLSSRLWPSISPTTKRSWDKLLVGFFVHEKAWGEEPGRGFEFRLPLEGDEVVDGEAESFEAHALDGVVGE